MVKPNSNSVSPITAMFVLVGAVFFVLLVAGAFMYGIPKYNVWRAGQAGEALLLKATSEKQIVIQKAQAELEAAESLAKTIALVGQAAKEFPEYRQQQFLDAFGEALQEGTINQIIYVPTEGNIPLLEAGKR